MIQQARHKCSSQVPFKILRKLKGIKNITFNIYILVVNRQSVWHAPLAILQKIKGHKNAIKGRMLYI